MKDETLLFPLVIRPSSEETLTAAAAPAEGKKRHGRLVAGILATFVADPDAAPTVADLAMRAYGVELRRVTKKHRVAVLRAMRRVCEVEPRFGLMDGDGPQGQVVLYDRTWALSYGLARLKADHLYRYQWHVPNPEHDQPRSEEELKARLVPGAEGYSRVVEGGTWWQHCLAAQAEVVGNHEAAARLWDEQRRRFEAEAAEWVGAFGPPIPRRPRPAPIRLAPGQPDPAWYDDAAWNALWMAAEFRVQQRDLVVRRVRAAGGTVHRWHITVPRDLFRWGTGWLDWMPYEAGFKRVFWKDRARGEAA